MERRMVNVQATNLLKLPRFYLIQTARSCNSHCLPCPHHELYGTDTTIMTMGTWELLVDQIKTAHAVSHQRPALIFNLMYEPLTDSLLDYRIISARRTLATLEPIIGVCTNGILIHGAPSSFQFLDTICLSILGDMYGDYSYHRLTGRKWRWVMDTLKYMYGQYPDKLRVNLTMWDFEQLGEVLSSINRIGEIPVTIGMMIFRDEHHLPTRYPTFDHESIRKSIEVMNRRKGYQFFELDWTFPTGSGPSSCAIINDTMSIDVGGNVWACHISPVTCGTLDEDIITLFGKKILLERRKGIESGNPCDECIAKCPQYFKV